MSKHGPSHPKVPSERPTPPNGLHYFGLCGLVVAQPLFDLLARHAEFFSARRSEPVDLLLFAGFLTGAIPISLAATGRVLRAVSPRLASAYSVLVLFVFFGLFGLLLSKRIAGVSAPVATGTSLLIAVALTLLSARREIFRRFLSALAPCALIFPLVFLLDREIRQLAFATPAITTGEGQSVRRVPLVLVVFDELPISALMTESGELDHAGFPGFSRLARKATWFRNATTVAPVTNYAVPALLAGLTPDRPRLPILSGYPQNLFTLLGRSHSVHAYESFTRLCPPSINRWRIPVEPLADRLTSLALDASVIYAHLLLPDGFLGGLPPLGHRWGDFLGTGEAVASDTEAASLQEVRAEMAKNRRVIFEQFVDGLQPTSSRPGLHFLHLLLPHTPWRYYPSGAIYSEQKVLQIQGLDAATGNWQDDPWPVTQAYQRFLLQVQMVDGLIGDMVEELERLDLYDSALVIVTADHGVSFRPGLSQRELTEETRGDILAVPLFVKLPRSEEGRIDDRNVELIDVLPTIAELLGFDLGAPVHGDTVLDSEGRTTDRERPEKRFWSFFKAYEDRSETLPGRTPLAAESASRKASVFGDVGDEAFYRIGEHARLVGRPAAPHLGTALDARASFDQAALFLEVEPDGGFLPGLIEGSVVGLTDSPGDEVWLAVSLNGIIAATTRARPEGKNWTFTSLLPENFFRSGENLLEISRIDDSPTGPVLRPLTSLSPEGACSYDAVAEVLRLSDGHAIPVDPGAVRGFVDRIEAGERTTRLFGWAIESDGRRVADHVVVTEGDRCVFSGRHQGLYRPDAERHYSLPRAGYVATLPTEPRDDSKVRVFAVSNALGRASELAVHPNLGWAPRSTPPAPPRAREPRTDCRLGTGFDGGERFFFDNGISLPVQINAVKGFVDHVDRVDDQIRVRGWALAGDTKSVAAEMILAIDGQCVFFGPHSRSYRADMERHYGLPNAGYELSVPAGVWPAGDAEGSVRVFGISAADEISELAYHPWFPSVNDRSGD